MQDNAETSPDVISASGADPFNAVLNVNKQETLGIVTAGLAPATVASNGWVGPAAENEAVQIPGQYSESPAFTGGTGTTPTGTTGGPTGGYGGHHDPPDDDDPFDDDPFGGGFDPRQNI